MTLKRTGMVGALAGLALAAIATGQFTIDAYTIDGGGGKSTGGSFSVEGTIGQPDASNVMTGGNFQLVGGFWGAMGNCPADFNGDGVTDLDDLQLLLFYFGTPSGSPADADGDSDTDLDDLQLLLFLFGTVC